MSRFWTGYHWKDRCWSWNSNTLATSCKELIHWKRPWCWEGLGAGGEGDNRGWDGWMASLTRWAWAWVNSGSWWWTGRPGMLRFMGLQRVRHDWATELKWTDPDLKSLSAIPLCWLWDGGLNHFTFLSLSFFNYKMSIMNKPGLIGLLWRLNALLYVKNLEQRLVSN